MQYQRVAGSFFKMLSVILLVCIPAFAFAQEEEKESPFYMTLDVATKNIWRGIGNGKAPLVYPTVGLSAGGFEVYGWWAYAVDNSYNEINIAVNYSFSNFTIELVDYFFPGPGSDFFNFRNRSTTHSAEAILYYEPESVPIYVILGSTIYGDDKLENGKNAFSSYAEVGYTHQFNDRNSVTAVAGFSINKGYYTDYEKGFYPVNLTAAYTRIFTLWNYDIPASATIAYNPYMEKFFWNIGLSFSIF